MVLGGCRSFLLLVTTVIQKIVGRMRKENAHLFSNLTKRRSRRKNQEQFATRVQRTY